MPPHWWRFKTLTWAIVPARCPLYVALTPHAPADVPAQALPTANGALTAVADAPTPFESAEAASTQGNVATTPSQDAGADAPPAAADVAAAGDDSLARGEGVDAAAADAREEAMDPSNQSTS
eukprot:6188822-Pleurochrysis_carterae.AAC.1